MTRPTLFPLVDKALGGRLVQWMEGRRGGGASFDAMARELHDEGIEVSAETLRKWFHEKCRVKAAR